MPDSESDIRLGRLEMQIMNVVWECGQATVHDAKDAITKGKSPAYSTILTMMRKLEQKGYLEHTVKDRTYVYQATIKQEDVRRDFVSDLVDRLFSGSPSLLVNSLLDQSGISEDEVEQIKALIQQKEQES